MGVEEGSGRAVAGVVFEGTELETVVLGAACMIEMRKEDKGRERVRRRKGEGEMTDSVDLPRQQQS